MLPADAQRSRVGRPVRLHDALTIAIGQMDEEIKRAREASMDGLLSNIRCLPTEESLAC